MMMEEEDWENVIFVVEIQGKKSEPIPKAIWDKMNLMPSSFEAQDTQRCVTQLPGTVSMQDFNLLCELIKMKNANPDNDDDAIALLREKHSTAGEVIRFTHGVIHAMDAMYVHDLADVLSRSLTNGKDPVGLGLEKDKYKKRNTTS